MPRIQPVKCFEFGEFMEETMWAGAVREGFLEELSLGVRPGRNQQGMRATVQLGREQRRVRL